MRLSHVSDRFSLVLCLPLLLLAFGLTACGSDGAEGEESDEIAYNVGEPLSDSTVALVVSSEYGTDTLGADQYRQQLGMQMQRQSPNQRSGDQMQSVHRNMVRGFVGRHVMQGEAQAQDLEVDTAQVTAQLNQIKDRYESEEQFQQQLAQQNVTIDSLRSYIANQMQQQALQEQMSESFEQPSEDEVQEYSKENRRIRAQHILIRAGENAPQSKVDSARQAAQALLDSAQAGSNFAELARRHSEGPSAEQGGDLGYFTRDQMVEEFSDAAYALADSGDVAPEPVRTEYGFHVIRLTDSGEPMDTSQARQKMTQQRRQDAFQEELDSLMEKATVRVNPNIVEAGLDEG